MPIVTEEKLLNNLDGITGYSAAVAHLFWEQKVGSSILSTPTKGDKMKDRKNNEQFLNDIIKEFKILYPKVEFTLGDPDESGKQDFFANGQNLKIRWSKKLVEDLIVFNNTNALDELRLILIEQLSISMSALKNSNENEKRND